MDATRQLFWDINGKGFMYAVALAAFIIFFIGLSTKIRGWKLGRNGIYHADNIFLWFSSLLLHDKNIFKGAWRRFMHLWVFYGFLVLLIGTIVIALQENFKIHLFYGYFYLILSLLLDLFGFLALIGVVILAYKRFLYKFDGKSKTVDAAVSLSLIFIILLTGFILEGLRIFAAGDIWARWTPFGLAVAVIAQRSGLSIESAKSVYAVIWYGHMLLAMGLIAYIPYSKLFHMVASPLNILLKSSSSIGALTPVGIISAPTNDLGVARLEDFTKKQLLELDACLSCLRCEKHCPAYESGAPFSPRLLMEALQKHAQHQYSFLGRRRKSFDSHLMGNVISKEALLSCTSCGLCEVKCPVKVEHVSRIIDLRRSFMSEADQYPPEVQETFGNLLKEGNPWGTSPSSIGDWGAPLIAEKKNTDILFWVGCFGTYDSRNKQVTQAMINILKRAGVDFAVMGSEEKCCGDTARRLGNELLFQQLAMANIKTLNGYKFNTIVTVCPHCYNTLKNEYPELGASYSVLHHSEYILQLIEAGRIKPQAAEKRRVTFHDPCYLGRYNSIFEEPRKILASIPGLELAEMRNIETKSHCCGAGGGQIWLEDNNTKKISALRAREAIKVNPDIIASACPLCLGNLSAAVYGLEPGIKNLDIAEIINDALIDK